MDSIQSPNLEKEYDRCVNELKLKGIKLGPNYQDFHPISPEAMKLYSKLEKDNIPIIFHQGTSPVTNAPLDYAHPKHIDKVAMVFPNLKIINKWPDEAFKEIETNENSALIALTHDPKIDDPALQHALKKKFYYIGALGSKKTHENRCKRLKEAGFSEKEINLIDGPIGIKLGGKSEPEIALSIITQLVSNTKNNK